MTDYNIQLSTTEDNAVGVIKIRQDDNKTQKIIAKITSNGSEMKVSDYVVFFNAVSEGQVIARDLAKITNNNSTVEYTLTAPFYSKTGKIDAFFSFEKEGKRDSTANFVYHVIPGSCRGIKGGSYIYDLEELKNVSGEIVGSKDLSPLLEKNRELNASFDGLKVDVNDYKKETDNQIDSLKKDFSDFTADQKKSNETFQQKVNNQISDAENKMLEEIKRHEVKDSGWMNLELVGGFKSHDLYPLKFRVIGKQVYFSGCVLNESKDVVEKTFAKIPRSFAPEARMAFSNAQMSSDAKEVAQIAVWQNGEIQIVGVSAAKNVFINQCSYPLV